MPAHTPDRSAVSDAKETVSATLKEARDKPDGLLFAPDRHREPRSFRISLAHEMGAKRGKGPGSFVNDSKRQAIDFYRGTVQSLKPWSASAPKLPAEVETTQSAPPEAPDVVDEVRESGEATLSAS